VSSLAEIEATADALPEEQKEQLLAFLAARLGWTLDRRGAGTSSPARRAGLHAGAWQVAPDFDAPRHRAQRLVSFFNTHRTLQPYVLKAYFR
jgi:hypothetical protein